MQKILKTHALASEETRKSWVIGKLSAREIERVVKSLNNGNIEIVAMMAKLMNKRKLINKSS